MSTVQQIISFGLQYPSPETTYTAPSGDVFDAITPISLSYITEGNFSYYNFLSVQPSSSSAESFSNYSTFLSSFSAIVIAPYLPNTKKTTKFIETFQTVFQPFVYYFISETSGGGTTTTYKLIIQSYTSSPYGSTLTFQYVFDNSTNTSSTNTGDTTCAQSETSFMYWGTNPELTPALISSESITIYATLSTPPSSLSSSTTPQYIVLSYNTNDAIPQSGPGFGLSFIDPAYLNSIPSNSGPVYDNISDGDSIIPASTNSLNPGTICGFLPIPSPIPTSPPVDIDPNMMVITFTTA